MLDLNKFLIKAKIATYASKGEGREKRLKDGSKELTFEEGNFKYRDRYFGFNPFSGEEVVFKADKAVWSMNYYGKILFSVIPDKEIYEFLKRALRRVKEDKPFRGPERYEEGDLEYLNKCRGEALFNGTEKILYKGQEVYQLYYHGGLVK